MQQEEQINVNGNTCSNVTVEPVTEKMKAKIANIELGEDDFLKQFSDKPLEANPEQAKAKLNGFMKYLKSQKFVDKINAEAMKTGIPPKKLAKGFISKAIGTLGDVLGIAIGTVQMTLNGLLDLIHCILGKGIDIIMNAFRGLVRIVTFNQTAIA